MALVAMPSEQRTDVRLVKGDANVARLVLGLSDWNHYLGRAHEQKEESNGKTLDRSHGHRRVVEITDGKALHKALSYRIRITLKMQLETTRKVVFTFGSNPCYGGAARAASRQSLVPFRS